MSKIKSFMEFVNEGKGEFEKGQKVKIKSVKSVAKKHAGKEGTVVGSSGSEILVKIPRAKSPEIGFFKNELELIEETLNEKLEKYDPTLLPEDIIKTLTRANVYTMIKSVKREGMTFHIELPRMFLTSKELSVLTKNRNFSSITKNTLVF